MSVIKSEKFIITAYFTDKTKKRNTMTKKKINIWYDKEADYLEINFKKDKGYFKETENDAVMEKVDAKGEVIGFSILKVSNLKNKKPISIDLSVSIVN